VRPNNTIRNVTYDLAGQVNEIRESTASGAPIAYFKLARDEAGRVTSEFIAPLPTAYTEPAQTMTYDDDNRISTFTVVTTTINVVHDNNGNMTSGPLNGPSAVAHVYDGRNRLTSVAQSGSAPALSYGYDSEGNRTSVTQAGQTAQYVIDPVTALPRTLTRTVGGVTTYYVYGPGLLYEVDATTGNILTYHYDSRGSTVALSNGSGTVTDRADYSIYGAVVHRSGATVTPFLYNGCYGVMTDANGLYYMRARYYNPYLKRNACKELRIMICGNRVATR
jgi:YD repeat-containing protein